EFILHFGPNLEAIAAAADVAEHGSHQRRLDALRVLSRASATNPRVETALLRALRGGDQEVSGAALMAICNMPLPPADAAPEMVACLASERGSFGAVIGVRAGLTKMGVRAVGPLSKATTHPSVIVRTEAVKLLWNLANTEPTAADA